MVTILEKIAYQRIDILNEKKLQLPEQDPFFNHGHNNIIG